jgi:hypothetical protein
MKQSKHGSKNKALAIESWGVSTIAKAYFDEMMELTENES